MRVRRRYSFEGLSIFFAVARGTAHNYYLEILEIFHSEVVFLLVRPLSPDAILAMAPPHFVDDLPGALVVWDATGFAMKSSENVALSRLLWSGYHNRSEAFVVFGEQGVWMVAIVTHKYLPQAVHPMEFSCFGRQSMEACQLKSRPCTMTLTSRGCSKVSVFGNGKRF